MPDFQDSIQNSKNYKAPKKSKNKASKKEEIVKELDQAQEKEFLKSIKGKNKNYLVKLDFVEKERIAKWICARYDEVKGKHKELCDRLDEYDSTYRMERVSMPGDDGSSPNYRTPLSTVALEVVHAQKMNVIFSPKEVMRVLPTEQNDVKKVRKLTIFGNWSMENELHLFEKIDRLFHSSGKNGECPYIVHWVKEYGTKIEREMLKDPANPGQVLYDPDTKEPLYQEREETVLLYNAPKLEIISRRDYLCPLNSRMDVKTDWDILRFRKTYDWFIREQMEGKIYDGSVEEITDWNTTSYNTEAGQFDYLGDYIPTGAFEKEFLFFYGRMRVNVIKEGKEEDFPEDEYDELEDEFIAMVHYDTQTLCSFRKNKFPMKMRPVDVDYFIPDDDGRRAGIGVMEFMKDLQSGEDALFNQFLRGVIWANSPPGFFTPTGNMRDEPIKAQAGYLYPTASAKDVSWMKIPPPGPEIQQAMERFERWAQLLFGISDYTAGVESTIDPTAPAKKAEIVVAQGNVRFNLILKRKLVTLKNIFLRWYLLYRENLPPNKFMRITGEKQDDWAFEQMTDDDFSLTGLPDFELTGNILNANKTLEAAKKTVIYDRMIGNPFFAPTTAQGIQALAGLTKWWLDSMEETGISRLIPSTGGEMIQTPEEENARFMQGEEGEPVQGEDHIGHIKTHMIIVNDPSVPTPVKEKALKHIKKHVTMMTAAIAMQMQAQQQMSAMSNQAMPSQMMGGFGGQRDAEPVDEAASLLRE